MRPNSSGSTGGSSDAVERKQKKEARRGRGTAGVRLRPVCYVLRYRRRRPSGVFGGNPQNRRSSPTRLPCGVPIPVDRDV